MRNGTLEVTWVTVGFFGSYEPILNVIESGYLFRDSQHSYKVFDGPMGKEIRGLVEKHGVKLLGYYEAGLRHITNSVRPIRTPEDLKGLKIRTPQAKYHLNTLKYMGANPVAMSFGELYTAMQQKVVDGQENPVSNIYKSKFYEVQKVHVPHRAPAPDPHGHVQRQAVGEAAGRPAEGRARVGDRVPGDAAQGGPGRRREPDQGAEGQGDAGQRGRPRRLPQGPSYLCARRR